MTEEDLKRIWREQTTEVIKMNPHDLKARSEKFGRTIRRRNRIEILAGAIVIAVFLFYAWQSDGMLMRTGSLLAAAGVGVVLAQLRRRAGAGPLGSEPGMSCLQFHRAALVRQRDALRSAWAWYVMPLVPGMVVFQWGQATELAGVSGMAVGILAATTVAIFVAVALLNRHAAGRLDREIQALDRLA